MPWSFNKTSPIYQQIADVIRRRIVCGIYAKGSQLPSVRDLALEAAVNPNTMQRAFASLEGDGLIETKGTQGRYVTDSDSLIREARDSLAATLIKAYFTDMEDIGIDGDTSALLAQNFINTKEIDNSGKSDS